MYNTFDINKFCSNRPTVGYNKLVTTGNNPKLSKAMQYSQYLRTKKPCKVNYNNLFLDVSQNIETPVNYDLQLDMALDNVTGHSNIDVNVLPSTFVLIGADASNNNIDIKVAITGIMIINNIILPYTFTDTYSQEYNSVSITSLNSYDYNFTAADVPVTYVTFYYTFTTTIRDSLVELEGNLLSDTQTASQIYSENNLIDLSMTALYKQTIMKPKTYGFTQIDPIRQQTIYALSKQPIFTKKKTF